MGGAALPEPIAEGSLASRPFAHLLLYIQQRGLDGTLVIWAEEGGNKPAKKGQDRVRFRNGKAVAGRFVSAGSTFERSMLQLFTRVNSPYAFYDRDLVGTGDGVLTSSIEPAALIAASLRGAAREDAINAVLRRFGQTFVRIRTDADIRALGLNAREKNFVDLIRADATTAEQLVEISGDERTARRLLYLLAITRCIEPFKRDDEEGNQANHRFGPVSVPPGAPAASPTSSVPPSPGSSRSSNPPSRRGLGSLPPGSGRPKTPTRSSKRPPAASEPPPMPEGLSPELAARWQEVADFASKIDTMTYFEMLDVPASMKASDITNAYFTMVKRWHPDRLPKELAPLKPSADVIFRNLTKAKDTLTDPEERTVYQRNVEAGGGTPESERQVNAIIEAAMAVQRAEIMLKQRDWAGALTLAEEARELSPENGDCLAIIAWSKFQLQSCEPPYGEMLGLLKKSLELNENSQKAHFYRAKIFQRKGDEKKALAEFDKVIQINPRHTEAMREVRVANMRGSKKDGGGFLSKLFGGDSKGKGKGKGKKR